MNWIARNIKWIMLASGLLTCTMFYAAVDPQGALMSTFGATMEGPLVNIVVRNWGALIGMVGVAVGFDVCVVLLFATYLMGRRNT